MSRSLLGGYRRQSDCACSYGLFGFVVTLCSVFISCCIKRRIRGSGRLCKISYILVYAIHVALFRGIHVGSSCPWYKTFLHV